MSMREIIERWGFARDDEITVDTIRRRYYELALVCHPDMHPGDAAAALRFIELGEERRRLELYAQRCRMCGGSGRIKKQSGFYSIDTRCPSCTAENRRSWI